MTVMATKSPLRYMYESVVEKNGVRNSQQMMLGGNEAVSS